MNQAGPSRAPARPAPVRNGNASTANSRDGGARGGSRRSTAPSTGGPRRSPGRPRATGIAPRRSVRWLLVSAAVCAAPGVLLLLVHLVPEVQTAHPGLATAAAFAPFGVLAWAAALVFALLGARGRSRLIAAPLALGLTWHAAVLAPYFPGRTATAAGDSRVEVLALNLDGGRADLVQLADTVAGATPDLLVLTEVTRSNAAAFARKPWARAFPYRSGTAGSDAGTAAGADDVRGTMVLSRHPLTDLGHTTDTQASSIALRVALKGHPFTLIAAHPAGPDCGIACWLQESDALTRLALAHSSGPLLVAGDLNATREQLTLRVLSAKAGLHDSASGSGWQPTYPANSWLPPLLAVDHVLASRQFSTAGYRTVRVAGTDHLGVLASLVVS